MKCSGYKSIFAIGVIFLFNLVFNADAQTNQTVVNGSSTTAVNFPGSGCVYNWVNNTPGIGLSASGSGNIPSFNAINTGNTPIIATITATPKPEDLAYVSNEGSNTVTEINTLTNTVVATIGVGNLPWAVAVSPDGSRAYVSNDASHTVSVINTATNAVIATIPAGVNPSGILVSPDGNHVYVTTGIGNSVSVISTATNAVIATIPISPAGSIPSALTISPDGNRLYVSNQSSTAVNVINTANNTLITTIAVDPGSESIQISPDGSRVYVTSNVNNELTVINATTNTVIATIPLDGSQPFGIAVSPDGSRVYVANQVPGSVSVINALTNALLLNIPLPGGSNPIGVTLNPDGSLLYAAEHNMNEVSVISTATNTIIARIPITLNPSSISNFFTNCHSSTVTFTITVNPTPKPLPVITAGTASGNISACAGTASASPDIQQFIVSGSNLLAGITATAPAGFEVSLTASSGYGNSVTIQPSNGIVNGSIVYVRSAASATGNISGNVILTSPQAISQPVDVTGTVSILPTINSVTNQTVNSGVATTAINFTGTANTFNWINNMPVIGLPASGTGNIPSFTATNSTGAPVIATIIVTPALNGSVCSGTPATFTITVNPQMGGNSLIIIPNAFTPNGDNINDLWDIPSLIDYPACMVSIFNRYGSLIYQSRGYAKPWDGTYKGSQLPVDTYYYIINLHNGQPEMSGPVTLIR